VVPLPVPVRVGYDVAGRQISSGWGEMWKGVLSDGAPVSAGSRRRSSRK
jgi:hypothetical protein